MSYKTNTPAICVVCDTYADYHYSSVHTWTTGGDTYTTTTESIYFTGTDYTQCDLYRTEIRLSGTIAHNGCNNGKTQIVEGRTSALFCGLWNIPGLTASEGMVNGSSKSYYNGCGHKRTVTTTHTDAPFVSVPFTVIILNLKKEYLNVTNNTHMRIPLTGILMLSVYF